MTTAAEALTRGAQPVAFPGTDRGTLRAAKGPVFLIPYLADARNIVAGLSWLDRLAMLQGIREQCALSMRKETTRTDAYVVMASAAILTDLIRERGLRWGAPPVRGVSFRRITGGHDHESEGERAEQARRRRGALLHNRISPDLLHAAYRDVDVAKELKRLYAEAKRKVFEEPVFVTAQDLTTAAAGSIVESRREGTPGSPPDGSIKKGFWLLADGPLLTGRSVVQVLRYYGLVAGRRSGAKRGWLLYPGRLDFVLDGPIAGYALDRLPWMAGRYFAREPTYAMSEADWTWPWDTYKYGP